MPATLEKTQNGQLTQRDNARAAANDVSPLARNFTADWLQRGFALAHFLVPERTTALQTLTSALNKLKSKTNQERKRAYWRDKFLKRQITRITRDDEDTLQWLIYFESDVHEKLQESLGQASEQDMVVRYVKALVRLSTGMSSFYVNIAIHRLLHRYTTLETQKIYEFVADSYHEADEYRRAKLRLMVKLETRFGERIHRITVDRGETKYELAECQGMWRELVLNCLEMFTPWSTQAKCGVKQPSDIPLDRFHEAFGLVCDESGNQDKIEINRCHAFIDPVCSDCLAGALGLEQHSSKLGVPRFYMDAERNIRPPSPRLPQALLTDGERRAIADALSSEQARRKKVVPRELSFLIDGLEHARLRLDQSRELEFPAPLGYQLLEIWTEDEQGPLLLGAHIAHDDRRHSSQYKIKLALKAGLSISISVVTEPDDEPGSCRFSVSAARTSTSGVSLVREWLAHVSVIPAYACVVVLLVAIGLLWAGLSHKLATERSHERELRTELAREREAGASSQLSGTAIAGPRAYRLTPDDWITRGSDGIQEPAITVPQAPMILNLELPVPKVRGQYLVVLKALDGRRIVLAENGLPQIQQEGKTVIVMSVPSTLLAPSQYYRVELQDRISGGVRTFTFYTAPAQP